MVNVRFVTAGGEVVLDVAEGSSVMLASVENAVEGAQGDCGGNMSCGTCHCYIDAGWRAHIPDPGDAELAMLEGVLDRTEDSRLGCQVRIGPALEGLVVRVPEFKL